MPSGMEGLLYPGDNLGFATWCSKGETPTIAYGGEMLDPLIGHPLDWDIGEMERVEQEMFCEISRGRAHNWNLDCTLMCVWWIVENLVEGPWICS